VHLHRTRERAGQDRSPASVIRRACPRCRPQSRSARIAGHRRRRSRSTTARRRESAATGLPSRRPT
jgi:hypothetical protein